MGEASRKSRKRSAILAAEPRCIYCSGAAASLEHMPPISIFRDRHRLSGLEFACCKDCNSGTRAADAVAALLSFIARPGSNRDWHDAQIHRLLSAADQLAPGLRSEITADGTKQIWVRTPTGLFHRGFRANGNGPILKRHMDVFSAKFGLALYREHVGEALPIDGRVYSRWFLNSAIDNDLVQSIISILPLAETLRMGEKIATEQFAYRYNCDGKTILAALAGFHTNLHVFTIATASPDIYGPALNVMRDIQGVSGPWFDIMAPGQLVQRLVGAAASA